MTISPQFPVTIPNFWTSQNQPEIPDPYLKNWLLDSGSLTEKLQSHCVKFDLQLIGQRQTQPELEEIRQFSLPDTLPHSQSWQIREVILYGNEQPWVFARSILPQALCDMDLANLGNKPLGQIIFNDTRFVRQPFQVLHIPRSDPFLSRLGNFKLTDVWGRRSVFEFNQLQLMVAEVFLPQCPAYRQPG